ncbi:MAG: hypothetical protein JWN04_4696 [Myxococcaceae bacterium]|nr:hypothetical protein [Myxococcaceae bacterium]
MTERFWESKSLTELSEAEWESLCDGCGKCCLHKLEDEDTGRIHLTMVACKLLDLESCRCNHYAKRRRFVPACVRVLPETIASLMLPASCAYRVLAEGGTLSPWHPLISGRAESVHEAGVSVRGRAISEREVAEADFEDYVVAEEIDPDA